MDYTACEICGTGEINRSTEVGEITCNVRYFRDESFTVWRCPDCRSLHCLEQIDFDLYYDHYPLSEQRIQYLTRRSYFNRIRILKRAGLGKNQTILDYGCGAGLFLEMLKAQGYLNATGYDPFVSAYAKNERLDESYDAVYSFGVVEHVPDPRVFFQTQRALVGDRGIVVVATPNADGLLLNRPNGLLLHQPYHRHILSSAAMQQLAESCGLRMVRCERRNWLDTLHPGLNGRFVAEYIDACGGFVDALFEKKRASTFLCHPRLWWSFWFGYFQQRNDYMICAFRPQTDIDSTGTDGSDGASGSAGGVRSTN